MLHTILWDWNGTLLDDVEVALAAMNEMLARRGLPLLQGREPYRDIFTFPVRVYYTAAGLDLSAEPFESLAVEWTGLYHRFYPRCGLFPAARAVLQAVGEMGLEQAIVSASHQQALDSQVEEQGLGGFFQARLGISDIYAGSKAGLAQRYLKSQGVPPEQALLIGDTLHDWEVAQEAGCPCTVERCVPKPRPPGNRRRPRAGEPRPGAGVFAGPASLTPAGNKKDAPPQKPRVPYQPTGCRMLRRLFFMPALRRNSWAPCPRTRSCPFSTP